jgi:DNA-binding transcriptional regulator YiaG
VTITPGTPTLYTDDAGHPTTPRAGVRLLRAKLGLSQAGLAVAVGVSARTVQNWETAAAGRPPRAPQAWTAAKLAKLLRKHERGTA